MWATTRPGRTGQTASGVSRTRRIMCSSRRRRANCARACSVKTAAARSVRASGPRHRSQRLLKAIAPVGHGRERPSCPTSPSRFGQADPRRVQAGPAAHRMGPRADWCLPGAHVARPPSLSCVGRLAGTHEEAAGSVSFTSAGPDRSRRPGHRRGGPSVALDSRPFQENVSEPPKQLP